MLVDERPRQLDARILGTLPETSVVAIGIADPDPVVAPILLKGIAARPLTPVHPRARLLADGSFALAWTRRARGAWLWEDGIDVPLHEEFERYQLEFGSPGSPIAYWTLDESGFVLSAGQLTDLAARASDGVFQVRQVGTRARSLPLLVAPLP